MRNVIINGNTYEEVQKVQIPLLDGSGNADFVDTTGATATAENIDKGYNAYVDGELIVGTKESESGSSPFKTEKIGTYNWSNPEGTTLVVEGCVEDLLAYAKNWYTENERKDTSVRPGIIIVADEKPTTTTGIKAVLGAAIYTVSTETVDGIATPVIIMTGAYYGGVDAVSYTVVASQQPADGSNLKVATSKLTECATCSIYTFDINF